MSIIFEKSEKFLKIFDFLKNLQKAKIFSAANIDQKMKNRENSDFRQNLQGGYKEAKFFGPKYFVLFKDLLTKC